MLEKSHLEIIREVTKSGSLTQAAKNLFLTQSAISHAIRKLESRLSVKIWEKDGRKLRLTQAGMFLLELSNNILPLFDRGEEALNSYARGTKGHLRIGMECHPCYQWLLKRVRRYLLEWHDVDLDVYQQFQFKGIAALYAYEIDVLITPDPVFAEQLKFYDVFPYEQVLVLHKDHPLAAKKWIAPEDLAKETLITYPVPIERLDIFQLFLSPAHANVAHHKTIETTEILLEMVAANRGVSALPKWLISEKAAHLPLVSRPFGKAGIHKKIHLGIREQDQDIDYIKGFITLAFETS